MSAPLAPPSSIDKIATLAGAWAIQIDVDGEWEWLIGATSFDLQTPKTLQNAGDINFGEWGGQVATEVNWTATMNLLKKLGQDGTVDEATKKLLACSVKPGAAGMVKMRCWRTDGFPDAWEGLGDVSFSGGGGDKTALNSTTCTITGYGPLEAITKPDAVPPVPTEWAVEVTGEPTGGTFTLTVGGQTTTGIAHNAAASAVQSALEALSTVGAGNATVTGTAGDYEVTLENGGTLTGSGAGLTGGTTPSLTVVSA